MKKSFLLVCLSAFLFSSCQKVMSILKPEEEVEDTVSVDSFVEMEAVEEDVYRPIEVKALTYSRKGNRFEYSLTCEYPVDGPAELLEVVRLAINKYVGLKGRKTYDESYAPQMFFKAWYDSNSECIRDIQQEYEESGEDYIMVTDEQDLKLVCQTEDFITFELSGYFYSGGAHGMPYDTYFTINKHTMLEMDWDDYFTSSNKKAILGLVAQETISQHFDGDASDYERKLPDANPAMLLDGLHFIYGAYEVASYAAGMPECNVPYSKISKYMKDEAKELIP